MPLPPWGPLLFPWRLTAGGFELSRGKCFPYIVIQLHPQEGEEEVGRVVLFPFSLWSGTREAGEQGSLLIKRLRSASSVTLPDVLEEGGHLSPSLEEAGTQGCRASVLSQCRVPRDSGQVQTD